MIDVIFNKLELLIYIYIRMLGFIVFNPIFGRRNIAAMIKNAIALVLAILLASLLDNSYVPQVDNIFVFMGILIKEFICGYLIGMIAHIFFSVVSLSGEIADMQMGLGMSKMYDPGSNIQMPLTGSFYNVALTLMFFISNCHINLVQICYTSYGVLPIGFEGFNADVGYRLLELFAYVFTLSIKFTFPIIAAELIAETGIGIIMRAVPQINVFVVGVQLKVVVALVVMIACAAVSTRFLDGMLGNMNMHIKDMLSIVSSGG